MAGRRGRTLGRQSHQRRAVASMTSTLRAYRRRFVSETSGFRLDCATEPRPGSTRPRTPPLGSAVHKCGQRRSSACRRRCVRKARSGKVVDACSGARAAFAWLRLNLSNEGRARILFSGVATAGLRRRSPSALPHAALGRGTPVEPDRAHDHDEADHARHRAGAAGAAVERPDGPQAALPFASRPRACATALVSRASVN